MADEPQLPPAPEYREDWVHCIQRTPSETWCGCRLGGWMFVDLTHAANNGRAAGRLAACPRCVDAAVVALKAGHADMWPEKRAAQTTGGAP